MISIEHGKPLNEQQTGNEELENLLFAVYDVSRPY